MTYTITIRGAKIVPIYVVLSIKKHGFDAICVRPFFVADRNTFCIMKMPLKNKEGKHGKRILF